MGLSLCGGTIQPITRAQPKMLTFEFNHIFQSSLEHCNPPAENSCLSLFSYSGSILLEPVVLNLRQILNQIKLQNSKNHLFQEVAKNEDFRILPPRDPDLVVRVDQCQGRKSRDHTLGSTNPDNSVIRHVSKEGAICGM